MVAQSMASVSAAIHSLPNPFPRVNLIKFYKGATLTQPGRIIAISQNSGMIQATQRLTFPILEGTVFLRSRAFPGAITANLHPVDISQGTFQLSDLTYTDWRDRSTERVQPKAPVYVDVEQDGKTFRTCLDDISVDGMGILVSAVADRIGRLSEGAKIWLNFQLTSEIVLEKLEAEVIYRQKVGPQLLRIGLRLFPDDDQKSALEDYVLHRYEEILEELKAEYTRKSEPCRVENLYF